MKRLDDGIDVHGKAPSFAYYPADFDRDVQMLSLEAQGLWQRMLNCMHYSPKRGYLMLPTGIPMTTVDLANWVGKKHRFVEKILAEMARIGLYSRDENGCIFSRRMAKDSYISERRKEAAAIGLNGSVRSATGKFDTPKHLSFAPANHPANSGHGGQQTVRQNTVLSSSSSSSLEEKRERESTLLVQQAPAKVPPAIALSAFANQVTALWEMPIAVNGNYPPKSPAIEPSPAERPSLVSLPSLSQKEPDEEPHPPSEKKDPERTKKPRICTPPNCRVTETHDAKYLIFEGLWEKYTGKPMGDFVKRSALSAFRVLDLQQQEAAIAGLKVHGEAQSMQVMRGLPRNFLVHEKWTHPAYPMKQTKEAKPEVATVGYEEVMQQQREELAALAVKWEAEDRAAAAARENGANHGA